MNKIISKREGGSVVLPKERINLLWENQALPQRNFKDKVKSAKNLFALNKCKKKQWIEIIQ